MLEREVDEAALERREREILLPANPRARRIEGARVAGEGARGVAEGVARELVEQEDARERALGSRGPCVELAAQRALDERAEARGDLRIERRVLAPPDAPVGAVLGGACCA